MERIEYILEVVDYILNSKYRRHVIGGALISVSLLFSGMAFTIMTLRMEDEKNGRQN